MWTASEMIIWGGTGDADHDLNTAGNTIQITNTWIAANIANAHPALDSHTAIWTGSQMIVWGGLPNSTPKFYLTVAGDIILRIRE